MSLDELIQEASQRVLSEAEIQDLCRMAEQEGRSEAVLVQLLSARTVAGRTNLAAAKSITAPHTVVKRSRRDTRQFKLNDLSAKFQQTRADNLPFVLTDHAVHRFYERHANGKTEDEIIAFLQTEARESVPLRSTTRMGDQQWISPNGVTFVIRRNTVDELPVCATVLPVEEEKANSRPGSRRGGGRKYGTFG